MKYIFSLVILLIVLILCLSSCSLLYRHQNDAVGGFDVGYSKVLRDAFLGSYNWDGSEEKMNIVLPETYDGMKITGMGGYYGKGVPTSFIIIPTEKAREALCPDATMWSYISGAVDFEEYDIQYLRFKLHISKNIAELEELSAGGIIVAEYEENGETKYSVYVLTCYVTCDGDNKTFYSKEGKLYYKSNDELVEGIVYEDFDIEKHNEENKDVWFVWLPFA